VNEFLRLLERQVAADLRRLPETARALMTDERRVARCRNIADLRLVAKRRIPKVVFDYVDGAAWDEVTRRRNQEDFGRFALRPRILVDVSGIDTATTVLGAPISMPIIGAPTGQTGLIHPDGEVAVGRALHAAGTLTTVSTVGSYSLEEVTAAAPGPRWFQLYVARDRGLARELVARARDAGYLALVVTVDVQSTGYRERDFRNRFSVPPRVTMRALADGLLRPAWSLAFVREPRITMANLGDRLAGQTATAMAEFINRSFDPSVTWDDLEWMRDVWGGPVVLKGVLRAEDAKRAAEIGVAGLLVSNHGGRQLDHAVSAVRALPAIVDAVGDAAEVYLDGGVRRGTDVLKAVALGARACMVGRPLMYGLGAGGEAGVARATGLLANELRSAMSLSGVASLEDIDASLLEPV
jgi:L-lactate dehydrogenase (cytochrome)